MTTWIADQPSAGAPSRPGPAADREPSGEGLRERKKRLMRARLSDTAAAMFLERGFDAVRVAEVARACGVSEKTVFNYFPTKEALLLDRLEGVAEALRTGLADPALPPVEAMLHILDGERRALAAGLAAAPDPDRAVAGFRRFGDLLRSTPSLRAYQGEVAHRFAQLAAQVLAARSGLQATDPEPQIAATALIGLWRIQVDALRDRLHPGRPVPDALDAVADDVRRAARQVQDGLARFPSAQARRRGTDR